MEQGKPPKGKAKVKGKAVIFLYESSSEQQQQQQPPPAASSVRSRSPLSALGARADIAPHDALAARQQQLMHLKKHKQQFLL